MTEDEKIALQIGAIWRLCEGDVSKFLPIEPVPREIQRLLDSGLSIGVRRSIMVAMLQSTIGEEDKEDG